MESSILQQLGLASHEEKVYITLLALGQLTTGEISRYSGQDYFQTERAIERLIERGLVRNVQGVSRFVAFYPFEGFVEDAQKGVKILATLGLDLDSYVTVKVEELRRRINDQKESIATSMASVRKEIEEYAEEDTGRLSQQAQLASERLQDIRTRALSRIAELTKSYSEEQHKLLTDMSIDIVKATQETETSVSDSIRSSVNELIQVTSRMTESRQNHIAALETTLQNTLDQFQSSSENIRSHLSDALSGGIRKFERQLDTLGTTLKNTLWEFLDENVARSDETTRSLTAEMTDEIKRGTESSSEILETMEGDLSSKLEEQIGGFATDTTYKTGIWPFKKEKMDLQQFGEQLRQLVSVTISEHVEQARRELLEMDQHMAESLEQLPNQIKVQREEIFEKFIPTITQTLSTSLEELRSIEKDSQDAVASFRNALTEIVSHLEADSSQINQADIERVQAVVATLKKSIDDARAQWTNSVSEEFTNMRKDVELTLESLAKTAAVSSGDYKSSTSEVLHTSTHSLLETLARVSDQSSAVLKDAMTKFAERIEQTKSAFMSEFDERIIMIDEVASALVEYSARFMENTQNVTKTMSEHETLLQSLLDEVGKAERDITIETAPIFGKESVLKYIHEMVVRTTSLITLLIPYPEDIPLEAIDGLKRYHRVVVVSEFDTKRHKHILQRLLSREATRVRHTSFDRLAAAGGDLISYIAAERDNEEICVATVSQAGEIIGLASRSEAHIALLGRIVIGDFFLAKSREIRRSEVFFSQISARTEGSAE